MTTETKTPHPHAALMAQYAADAAETDTPWERWQNRQAGEADWRDLTGSPVWSPVFEYRRKPSFLTFPVTTLGLMQKVIHYDRVDCKHINDYMDDVSELVTRQPQLVAALEAAEHVTELLGLLPPELLSEDMNRAYDTLYNALYDLGVMK